MESDFYAGSGSIVATAGRVDTVKLPRCCAHLRTTARLYETWAVSSLRRVRKPQGVHASRRYRSSSRDRRQTTCGGPSTSKPLTPGRSESDQRRECVSWCGID